MFPPEVVFCQVVGGVGRRTYPPRSRLKLPATFFVFQEVDWTLIHHFVDRTHIHSKPSGGSL